MNEHLLRLQPMLEHQPILHEMAGISLMNRIRNRELELEDMELNFGRHALAFDENEVASDEEPNLAESDSMEESDDADDDADELSQSLFSIRNVCPKRRAPHTMPGYGVDEHVTQPILWLALEQLKKHENMVKRKVQTGADVVDKKITSPSDFVANYLIENMTLDIFKNGNQPRYGPGLFSRRPPRRRMHGPRAL
ncbi:uncharacterized protein LOC6649319 isoform X2 [Drosophila willistoni]|nr:uncharacterized protein LOC6649319 isoform X2 [Drosophila willistoni]